MVITTPLCRVVDDSGAIVTGATVTITSVTDKAGSAISSPGATVNLAGANVSVDYDAEAKGEAWVTLAISKVGSTFTGERAAPAFYLAKDSGRLLSGFTAAGQVDVGKVDGVAARANNGAIASASSNGVVLDATDPLVVAGSNLNGYKVRLTGEATYGFITDTGTTATRVIAAWVNGPTPSTGDTYVLEAPEVLAPSGLDRIALESGVNARQGLAVMAAASAGVVSGADGTTIVIKGANTTTTRITGTVDEDGNRTAVTLNLPA